MSEERAMQSQKNMPTTIFDAMGVEESANSLNQERRDQIINRTITATAHEFRLNIFDPTRRPKPDSKRRRFETPWGILERFAPAGAGQAHADLLEAILFNREKTATDKDGERIKILVDPAKVRKTANITSGEQLRDLVLELQSIIIQVIQPRHLWCVGHLVDRIGPAYRSDKSLVSRYDPLTKGERALWRVDVGQALITFLGGDVLRNYDPAPIARLDHGISQAVARHIFTHKNEPKGGWTLDGLIQTVSGKIESVPMRHRRHEIRKDKEKLLEIGIRIERERVHIVKTIDI